MSTMTRVERAEELRESAEDIERRANGNVLQLQRAAEVAALADFIDPEPEPETGSRREVEASEVSFASLEEMDTAWLWDGRIPLGEVTLVAGKGGTGKSTVMCDLAARVSNGGLMPDGSPGFPGKVLMICTEDKLTTTVLPRLNANSADLDRVFSLSHVKQDVTSVGEAPQARFTIPDHLEVLEATIKRVGAVLVVIDNLMSVANANISTYRNQTVRAKIMDPLCEIAYRTGAAILLVAHFNKGHQKDPLTAIQGSGGITDRVRSVLGLYPDASNPAQCVLVHAKCNIAELARPMIYERIGNKIEWISGYIPSYITVQKARTLSEARQNILDVLDREDQLLTAPEIAQKTGLDFDNVRSHLSRMQQNHMIGYPTRNQYCSLAHLAKLKTVRFNVPL